MGPIAVHFTVQAFGWGSCWMFHWLFFQVLNFPDSFLSYLYLATQEELKVKLGCLLGLHGRQFWLLLWQQSDFAAFFPTCPIPGVVDMWDRQILSGPHLTTISKGDSLPWISMIHGAKQKMLWKIRKMAPCLIGSENSMPPFLCVKRFAGIDVTNLQRSQ